MASIHWLKAQDGPFNDAGDWSGGVTPGPGDAAILDAPGSTPYKVTVSASATVASIETLPTAVLDVLSSVSILAGAANQGALYVENAGSLTLQGSVANSGVIELFGGDAATSLIVGSAGVTLTGGGGVFLDFQGGLAQQIIAGPNGGVLDDVDNRISGQGYIGGPGLSLVTGPLGFIEAKAGLLTINTGTETIINAGTIDAEGLPNSDQDPPATGVIESPVQNDGLLMANGIGATLVAEGSVTGSGRAVLAGGSLVFQAGFNQIVDFHETDNLLILAQSALFTNTIQQFVADRGDVIDLRDIGFVGPQEASYSGSTQSGVLTVTDGVHTARLHFAGNYTGAVFLAASDGAGGTAISAEPRVDDWIGGASGSFQDPANWSIDAAPGPLNDAVLGSVGGAAYTVASSGTAGVHNLQIAADATLTVAGAFSTAGGAVVAGALIVENGALLTAGPSLSVTGRLFLAAATNRTELIVSGTTLAGGGQLHLGDAGANAIVGVSSSSTLANASDLIDGAGNIGVGRLSLLNQASGRIVSDQIANGLLINTGSNTVINAGLIEGAGAGLRVVSAIENDGLLKAVTSLAFSRAVTGSGRAIVAGGSLSFLSAFNQAVTFVGTGGVLALAQSRLYTGGVYGFSASGGDSFDLADIAYTGPAQATYSGGPTAGVLTVSDGTHAARISLHGDYRNVLFSTASDGNVGVFVTVASPLHAFVAAMAGLTTSPTFPLTVDATTPRPAPLIASPVR